MAATYQEQFNKSIEKGLLAQFQDLLRDPDVDPGANDYICVFTAVKNKQYEILEFLLNRYYSLLKPKDIELYLSMDDDPKIRYLFDQAKELYKQDDYPFATA